MKVAVVERDPKFGGTCLLRGCIPTKALLHTASVLDEIREAGEPRHHRRRAGARHRQGAGAQAEGGRQQLQGGRVPVQEEQGDRHPRRSAASPARNEVEVEGPDGAKTTYGAKFIMIATGSVPRDVPIAPTDGERILNSDHVLELKRVPAVDRRPRRRRGGHRVRLDLHLLRLQGHPDRDAAAHPADRGRGGLGRAPEGAPQAAAST